MAVIKTTSARALGRNVAGVGARNHKVCLVPVVASGSCAAVDSVTVNCDLDDLAVITWSNPFEVPRADSVAFSCVRKAAVHVVAE
jgi:hypothetical protein